MLKQLGSGEYGTVYGLNTQSSDGKHNNVAEFVIKQALFGGAQTNLFEGMHVERRMFELLSTTMLMTGACPHLPPFFGGATCNNKGENLELPFSSIVISKRAHYGEEKF